MDFSFADLSEVFKLFHRLVWLFYRRYLGCFVDWFGCFVVGFWVVL